MTKLLESDPMRSPATYQAARDLEFLRYNTVLWDMSIVSDQPLASFGFRTCSGLVLLEGKKAGLVHLYTATCLSKHLDGLLSSFDSPVAIINASASGSEKSMRRRLEERNVPVAFSSVTSEMYTPRDILVLPQEQEVRIYERSKTLPLLYRRD